ncbi:MAG: hypothetical protein AAF602_19980 [Myxococcota bacterium]
MIVLLSSVLASGAELRAVRDGDTIEAIAESLGDPALAGSIRSLNQLAAGAQPEVGRLLVLPPPVGVDQVDQQAALVSVVGDVTVAPPGQPPAPAEVLTEIPVGSVVCTAEDSYATIRLASACEGLGVWHDVVTLFDESCVETLAMVASTRGRSSVLRVTSGSVVVADPGETHEGQPPHEVTIQAAEGVATGRGGFRAHLESDEALRTEALTNELALLGGGQELRLLAGQGSRVHADGRPPDDPVALLGAGPLLVPAAGEPLRRPVFRWAPQDEAFGYSVAIAGDADFTKLLYRNPVPEPVHLAQRLLLPMTRIDGLWWQVASIDRFGFIGVPTPAQALGLPAEVSR